MLKNRSELYLALGLALLSLAAGVGQYVFLGLLAIPLVPIALALVVIGVKGTKEQGVSPGRQAVGRALLVFGVAGLFVVAMATSSLAYQAAVHLERTSQPAPTMGDWLLVATGGVLAATLIASGFRHWAGWSFRRCLGWAVAVLLVSPAALLLFEMLRPHYPLTT